MDCIYVFLWGNDWEDAIIFLSEEDAIKQSIENPNCRVEIFSKAGNGGYIPTYNYYKNGALIRNA